MTDKEKNKAIELAGKLKDKFSEEETESFINKFKNLSIIDDVKLLFNMIRDKDYQLDKATYFAIAGALAYVVFPVDIIPDFLPIVGFTDDAAVLAFVIRQLGDEIEKYKKFKGV